MPAWWTSSCHLHSWPVHLGYFEMTGVFWVWKRSVWKCSWKLRWAFADQQDISVLGTRGSPQALRLWNGALVKLWALREVTELDSPSHSFPLLLGDPEVDGSFWGLGSSPGGRAEWCAGPPLRCWGGAGEVIRPHWSLHISASGILTFCK